ncbi:MAG: creatininase family protein [Planctomycetota bacterium]
MATQRIFWSGLLLILLQTAKPDPVAPDPNTTRPIAAAETLFLEKMTWLEARDAMRQGKKTVIVATGGIEQNGPYLAANKHNLILEAMTDSIARKLGNALVAPIIGFVPEGNIDPPDLHMKYPTTMSLSEETYRRLFIDVCSCYRTHGFERIILLGDSGGNQAGMKEVAETLNTRWQAEQTRVVYVPEYYNYPDVKKWLDEHGVGQTDEGLHDDFAISALVATVDPEALRMKQRVAAGNFKINGVPLAPIEKTVAWGRKIIDFRTQATITAIEKRWAAVKPKTE